MSIALSVPSGVRRAWPTLRLVLGASVLAVLVWRFGTGPFKEAWRVTGWRSVLAVQVLIALSTLANAWRWRVIARSLGVPLAARCSLAAYYRSQFLNVTLPGGILGDAHRGVRHGRESGDLGAGLRATVWDRTTGQLVQCSLLVLALAAPPTPLRPLLVLVFAGLAAVGLVTWWLARGTRPLRFVRGDLRILAQPAVAGRVVVASVVSVGAHVAVFVVAMATVGVDASPALMVALALALLVGSALPLSVAGWGPREGIAATLFAMAGLGSATGLTVSVLLGVLGSLATWPGVLVLLADAVGRRRRRREAEPPPGEAEPTPVLEEAAPHG